MLIFDLETDGLLDDVEVIHCIHLYDTMLSRLERYNDHGYMAKGTIADGLARLGSAVSLIAHNGLGYDYQVLDQLYPGWDVGGKPSRFDTLTYTRLLWPDISEIDFVARNRGFWKIAGMTAMFPAQAGGIIGSHALKAWGTRFGVLKGDFNPKDHLNEALSTPDAPVYHTWKTIGWCKAMDDYCVQDVTVTRHLWELIESREPDPRSVELEHQFATVLYRQERFGFRLDLKAAEDLHRRLLERQAELADKLQVMFPPWVQDLPDFIPKRDNAKLGYKQGVAVSRKKTIVFNPGSRDHIADRLTTLYGWEPTETGPTGRAKVDETVLKALPYPPVPFLREYLTVAKRLGQLAEGKQAWLKAHRNGRIHGRVNTNGAVTGRCTHSSPNMAQVPAVRAAYGKDCRALFCVDKGRKLVGADASGLELRCLAHYMARFDDGAYALIVVEGTQEEGTDVHTMNQKAAGLDTRDDAKTFIYAFLYGAGDGKLGEIVGGGAPAGKRMKKQFLESLPALATLIALVQKKAKATGTLLGLDGRELKVRSPHAALNTLLQSAGALIMKKYLCIADDALQAAGLVPGDDYEWVANIHDETQCDVKEEHAELVARICEQSMQKAGEYFDFRCPIGGEAKIGSNWAETH